jgi:hypothetical protein
MSFLHTKQVYTKILDRLTKLHSTLLFLMLILAVLTLHPGIRPRWDSRYQENLKTAFINELIYTQKIEPRTFWLFRERYSPGFFTFNPEAVAIFQTFRIINRQDHGQTDLLYYHSPYLTSTESLVTDYQVLLQKAAGSNNKQYLAQADNFLLYQGNNSTLELWFVLPIEEMKVANGLFDYDESEMVILNDVWWLHHSIIRL